MKLRDMIQQKKQWRAHMRRVKTLPRDYQIVYNEMQKYIFNIGTVEFEGTTSVLSGIVDLMPEGAAAGKDGDSSREFSAMYTIKKGDTLWDISLKFNVQPDELARQNGIGMNAVLRIGAKLKVPAATGS